MSRRDLLKLAAAAAATPLLPRSVAAAMAAPAGAGAVAAGRFFSAKEMALLDELVEMIIPADGHSGGARAAGVAAYIDGRLAEYDPSIASLKAEGERWKAGLARVDALSRTKSSMGFLDTSPAERTALLERLDAALDDKALPTEEPEEGRQPNAEKPETAGQRFFVELKSWTTQGYYTSKIGIHDEMEYQGNKALVEFAGIDVATLPPVHPPED